MRSSSACSPCQRSMLSRMRKFGTARRQLDVRGAHHRAAVQVRRDLHVLHFRERGDLLCLQEAPHPTEVRLQDGGAARREQPREVVLGARRSPAAIGTLQARATFAISSGASGGTGSSNHSGSYGSMRRARRMAPAAVICPWVPKRRSAFEPTADTQLAHEALAAIERGEGGLTAVEGRVRAERIELQRRKALREILRRPLRPPGQDPDRHRCDLPGLA